MYKLAILFFTTVFAKLEKPSFEYILFEQFNGVEQYTRPPLQKVLASNAWVLSLDKDVEALKLREASFEEARGVFGAQGEDARNHRQPGKNDFLKKEASSRAPATYKKTVKGDEKAMLAEIMRVINKFALSTNNEPDVYLSEKVDRSTPSVKLYFKGAQTTLVVRVEGQQWHYIIRPALFPEWFYEEHRAARDERGQFVAVPRDVADEFYAALFHVLTMFLSFPV